MTYAIFAWLLIGLYHPQSQRRHRVKHRLYLIVHGLATPCPSVMADGSVNGSCGGGSGDLTLPAIDLIDPNVVANAIINPTACDPDDLDGDPDDDNCPTNPNDPPGVNP